MKEIDREDWKMCNCAECDEVLLGESMKKHKYIRDLQDRPNFVAGRINGKPFCYVCFSKGFRPQFGGGRGTKDEESPWGENAVRDMEDN